MLGTANVSLWHVKNLLLLGIHFNVCYNFTCMFCSFLHKVNRSFAVRTVDKIFFQLRLELSNFGNPYLPDISDS